MKAGKLTAVLLSLVMAAGAAGCSYNTVETTVDQESAPTSASAAVPETTAAASESVPAESGTGSYAEKPGKSRTAKAENLSSGVITTISRNFWKRIHP